MKKKTSIIMLVLLIGVLGVGIGYYKKYFDDNLMQKQKDHKTITKITEKINEQKQEINSNAKETLFIGGILDYLLPSPKGHEVAICQLDSIDRSDNRNPITKKRTTTIGTFGTLNIKKVLQGKLKTGRLKFTVMGGTILRSQYKEGMYPEMREKLERLGKRDGTPEPKFVENDTFGAISKLKTKKDFVCYLKYTEEHKTYMLISIPEMFREVTSYSPRSDEIVVRDMPKDGQKQKVTTTTKYSNFKAFDESFRRSDVR